MEPQPVIAAFSIPWMLGEWMWTIEGLTMTWENKSVGGEQKHPTTTCPSAALSVTHSYWGI